MSFYLIHADGCFPSKLCLSYVDDVLDMGHRCLLLVLSFDVADIAHHNVDESVLDEAEEDKEGAGRHEHVDGFDVGHGR